MKPYSEYVFLFGLMFVLFVAYLVITIRSDSTDFVVGNNKIPSESISNNKSLYIEPNCTNGSYASFKNNNSFYSSTLKALVISDITLATSNAAAGTVKLGYGDTTVTCGSIPSNAVILYSNTLPDVDEMLKIDLFLNIPVGKYPFIYLTGYNFSASGLGLEY